MAAPPGRTPEVRGASLGGCTSRRGSPAGGCRGGGGCERPVLVDTTTPATARLWGWPPTELRRCRPLASAPVARESRDLPSRSPCEPKRQLTSRPSRSNRRSRILGLPFVAPKPRVFLIGPHVTPGDRPLLNMQVGKNGYSRAWRRAGR